MLFCNPSWLDGPQLIVKLLAEADRMNTVVSNLLLLTWLDAGKLTVASKPFDLGSLTAETVKRFQERVEAK